MPRAFLQALLTFQPRNLRLLALGIILASTQVQGWGQGSDLKRLTNEARLTIPFTLENDFIVIDVVMNRRYALRFIVDTGAENTVLLDKEITDDLDVDYRRKFTVTGSDLERELVAYLATGINIKLADALLAKHRAMLVLEENYANLDRVVGGPIHGILGADFLMRFVVEIDYRRRQIILHEPSGYLPPARHVAAPSIFHRHRAYLQLPIAFSDPVPTDRKMLLDSGAGITMILHTYGDTLIQGDLPVPTVPSYIANGIGGNVNGNVGRLSSIRLAGREVEDVVAYFQPVDTVGRSDYFNDREGIIGNKILERYNVIIDYVREAVYLRADKKAIRRKFKYDRSGLSLVAGGFNLRSITVAKVTPGSPAEEAGLRIGDRISSMNRTSVTFLSLGGMIDRLRGRVGRRIRVKYVRDGKFYRTEFRLRELI